MYPLTGCLKQLACILYKRQRTIVSIHQYFSDNYQEARTAFLNAAQSASAKVSSYVHPSESGPDGGELAVDTAWIGPSEADVVLLCVSGTHGPEGFCGSAAQIQSLCDGTLKRLPDGVAVLMVHALNPFGFAYMTRYNENNVDLNRNWIDFTKVPKTPDLYHELHRLLPAPDTFDVNEFNSLVAQMAALLAKHGAYAIENALSAGQYEYPDGIGFGGQQLEWSTCIMRDIVGSLKGRTKHIAYLDWHSLVRSGLDDFVYLVFNKPGGQLFNRCRQWWGSENVDPESVDEKWSAGLGRAGGRPDRNGILMWGVQKCAAPEIDVAGGVIEFTDMAQEPLEQKINNAKAMLLSRYFVHKRQFISAHDKTLFQESRELWCPTRSDWQKRTLAHAARIFAKTLAGAAEWSHSKSAVVRD